MNGEDRLAEAMRALRDRTETAYAGAAVTRRRVLERAAEDARRRRRVAVVVVPLAAVFVISTAWGAVTGRLPRWLALLADHGSQPHGVVTLPQPAPPPPPAASSAPDSLGPMVTLPAASSPPRDAVSAPPAVSGRPRPPPSADRASPATTREQALYDAAHEAHFVARDPAAALRAWDAYLAAFPEGRFALEARYNRAITLVRLGRDGEARKALSPFARGEYGGYRRTEASELLDAMASADGGPAR